MASHCFADLLKAHHVITEPVVSFTDPLTGEESVVSGGDRAVVDADIDGLPDGLAYDLAVEHLGIHRCHAAFYRWTFDRTGARIEPDARAISYWAGMDALPQDDDLMPFAESAAIREAAYAAMGQELADDYMRATDRPADLSQATRLNAAVRLLAALT